MDASKWYNNFVKLCVSKSGTENFNTQLCNDKLRKPVVLQAILPCLSKSATLVVLLTQSFIQMYHLQSQTQSADLLIVHQSTRSHLKNIHQGQYSVVCYAKAFVWDGS